MKSRSAEDYCPTEEDTHSTTSFTSGRAWAPSASMTSQSSPATTVPVTLSSYPSTVVRVPDFGSWLWCISLHSCVFHGVYPNGNCELSQCLAGCDFSCFKLPINTGDTTDATGRERLANRFRNRQFELFRSQGRTSASISQPTAQGLINYPQNISRFQPGKTRGPWEFAFKVRTGGAELEFSLNCHFFFSLYSVLADLFQARSFLSRGVMNTVL